MKCSRYGPQMVAAPSYFKKLTVPILYRVPGEPSRHILHRWPPEASFCHLSLLPKIKQRWKCCKDVREVESSCIYAYLIRTRTRLPAADVSWVRGQRRNRKMTTAVPQAAAPLHRLHHPPKDPKSTGVPHVPKLSPATSLPSPRTGCPSERQYGG